MLGAVVGGAGHELVGERVDAGLQEGTPDLGQVTRRHQRLGVHIRAALLEVGQLGESDDADDEGDQAGGRDGGEHLDAEGQGQQARGDGQSHGGSVQRDRVVTTGFGVPMISST